MPKIKATHAVVQLTKEGADILETGSRAEVDLALSKRRAVLEGKDKYAVAVLPLDEKGRALLPP
jgi:hypothetical protein